MTCPPLLKSVCLALSIVATCAAFTACESPVLPELEAIAGPDRQLPPSELLDVDPATLAPADTSLFIRLSGLARFWDKDNDDPFAQHLYEKIQTDPKTKFLIDVIEQLNLDTPAFMQTYFGQSVALMSTNPGKMSPAILLTRVDPEEARQFPKKLGLTESGRAGVFTLFQSKAPQRLVAVYDRWLALARPEDEKYLEVALQRIDPTQSLASDPTYLNYMAKLPENPSALLYVNDRKKNNVHAAAAVTHEKGVSIDYVAKIERADEFYKMVTNQRNPEFGLLPDNTISAVSFNIHEPDPQGVFLLNLILFPKNLRDHVMPRIDAPLVLFLGGVPGNRIDPPLEFDLPVIGLALRLKDHAVTEDLDKIMSGIRFIGNVADLNLIDGIFQPSPRTAGTVVYHTADFGKTLTRNIRSRTLSKLIEMPEHAGLTTLSYGRIGDWYVVATHETFFLDCITALQAPARRLTSIENFSAFDLKPRHRLILSSVTRASNLASIVESVSNYWKKLRPQVKPKPDAPADPNAPEYEEDYDRPLEWFTNVIKHNKSFSIQLWRGPADHLLGRVEILR